MKTVLFVTAAFATLTSIPLMAQQIDATGQQNAAAMAAGTHTSDSAHANAQANASPRNFAANGSANGAVNGNTNHAGNAAGARSEAGFGDEAGSHEAQMSSVSGELEGKLDTKTAKVGDRVVLKTTEKARMADGTVIPKGSRLVGHVTQVQAHDKAHANSQMSIAFDRAELKGGQSFAIHSLIRGVSPSPSAMAMSSMNSEDSMGAPMGGGMAGGGMAGGRVVGGGMAGGGQAMAGGRAGGGLLGGGGSVVNGTGGLVGGTLDRTTNAAGETAGRTGTGVDETANSAVQATAGQGNLNLGGDAHALAAAHAAPHATGIPGIMLGGNSSSSGMFSAAKKNVEFENGTQMQLGVVADR